MKKIFEMLIYSILIGFTLFGIYELYNERFEGVEFDRKLEELEIENEELRITNDSLKRLLIEESFRYDSLVAVIDSSVDKYNRIEIRYKIIKDSVKYLDADESINFLRDKLNSHEKIN